MMARLELTLMTYDFVNNCCYVEDKELWSYCIGDKKWEKVVFKGDPIPAKHNKSAMACYNPELNVLMVDFGGGQVWVYRGKKPPSESANLNQKTKE